MMKLMVSFEVTRSHAEVDGFHLNAVVAVGVVPGAFGQGSMGRGSLPFASTRDFKDGCDS